MKLNKEQRLYVQEIGNSFSTLGFDVVFERTKALVEELNQLNIGEEYGEPDEANIGTENAYMYYMELLEVAQDYHRQTKYRFKYELTPQLIGLENKRVEVIDKHGEKRRFYVGKSTGFIPCHLEIARIDSTGGGAVTGAPFQSVRVIEGKTR